MKINKILLVTVLLVTLLSTVALPVYAKDPPGPWEELVKVGKCELENILDPDSPNYDPSQRYGGEGTRFGPPGNRTEGGFASEDDLGGLRTGRTTQQRYFGAIIKSGKSVTQTMAAQETSLYLDLSDSDGYLYAPTLMAPDYSRTESVAYYHYNGSSTDKYWKVWRHGTGEGFVWATQMNASFNSRYRYIGYVNTKIAQTGESPTWTVYLYDWIDYEWDFVYSSSGTGDHSHGWNAWEEYDLDDVWPDLPELQSASLKVYTGSNWYDVTSTYGSEAEEMDDVPYDYDWNTEFYDWWVGP